MTAVGAVGQVGAEQAGALQGDQATRGHVDDVAHQSADRRRGVDGGDRDGRVLGQCQRLVAADDVARAEAGDAPQHHTAGDLALGVEIQHRFGQEARARALAFTEVGGQLEVGVVHSRPAIHWPSIAAGRPSATLTTRLATAGQIWRSSVSRCVSSIQVEKVV